MEIKDLIEILGTQGKTLVGAWPAVVAIVAVVFLLTWRLKGSISEGEINALKGQIAERDARVAVIEERLRLAQDAQRAATEAQVRLQRKIFELESEHKTADLAERLFSKRELADIKLFAEKAASANSASEQAVSNLVSEVYELHRQTRRPR